MTRAIVLYHSLHGNTGKVAMSLAKGIEEAGIEVDCLSIGEVDITRLSEYDFVAIGGPTHVIRMSKPMKEFIEKIRSVDLRGKKGFAFDTRIHSRMNKKSWGGLENSAARRIEGKMKKMRIEIVRSRQSAVVDGTEGPLEEGTEEKFHQIGAEIAEVIA
jgi:menaquinone-dependent protoporphyrinogen IX oxidase